MANTSTQVLIRLIMEAQGNGATKVAANIRDIERALNQAQATNTRVANRMVQDWVRAATQIGSHIRQIGQGLMNFGMTISLAMAPVALQLKEGVEAAATWDQAMAALSAAMNRPRSEIDALGKTVLDQSKNFTFGANAMATTWLQVAEAIGDVQAAQIFAIQGATYATAVFDQAERTAENYRTTTLDLSTALRAFYGDEVLAAQQTGDWSKVSQLAADATNTLTTILNNSTSRASDFNEAFKMLFPTARLLGMSFNDTAIAIGMMSDKGILGSRAGRELASAFRTMIEDSPKVQDAFKAIGVSIINTDGSFKSLKTMLTDLHQAFFDVNKTAGDFGKPIEEASGKVRDAMESAVRSQAGFTASQLQNLERMRQAASTAIDQAALMAAMNAIRGTAAEVEQQTLALESNVAVWTKLSPEVRTWIQQMSKSADAAGDAQQKYNDLVAASEKLFTIDGKLTDVERIRLMQQITTAAGLRALEPLIEGGADAYERYFKLLTNGIKAEDVAKKKLDNLKDSFGLLKSNVEQALIKALIPLLTEFVIPLIDNVNKLINWFDKLDQPTKNLIILMAGLGVAIGPVLFGIGSMLFTMGMLMSGVIGLVGALPMLLGVFAPIATVFAAGAVAIAAVGLASADAKSPLSDLSKVGQDVVAWIKELPDKIDAAKGFLKTIGQAIIDSVDGEKIRTAFDSLGKQLGDSFRGILGGLLGDINEPLFKTITFRATPEGINQLDDTFIKKTLLTDTGKRIAESIGKMIGEVVNKIGEFVGEVAKFVESARKFLADVKADFDSALPSIIGLIDDVKIKLGELKTVLGEQLPPAIVSFSKGMTDMQKITDDTRLAFSGLVPAIQGVSSLLSGIQVPDGLITLSGIIDATFSTMKDMSSASLNLIGGLRGLSDAFKNLSPESTMGILGVLSSIKDINITLMAEGMQKIAESLLMLMPGIGPVMSQVLSLTKAIAKGISDAIIKILPSAMAAAAEFVSVGSAIVSSITEGIVAAAQSLIDAFLKALNDAWEAGQNLLYDLSGGALGHPPKGAASPGVASPSGRASGGPVVAGRTYMVGERGPEPFVPGMSGMIFPNLSSLQAVTAGGAPPINITVGSVRSQDDIASIAYEVARLIGRQ